MTVIKDTKVWETLKRQFRQDSKLSIGFFESSRYGPENDNLPVAYIAAIQDQGLGVPMRAFMSGAGGLAGAIRSTPYKKEFQLSMQRIVEGKTTFAQEYSKLGKLLVADTKEIIDDWSSPPNAALTVELKGFNDPLIETSTMRDSVEYRIEKDN
jgi:hypothetical protein